MVRRYLVGCLFIIQCAAHWAYAGTLQADLVWYRHSLQFSGIEDQSLNQFLRNVNDPIEQFRLSSDKAPWAGNFFAMENGGVAYRWQQDTFPQEILKKEQAQSLTSDEIHKLSPIEKYDLYAGNKGFKGTVHELKNRGPLRQDPPVQFWEGFCNGVRCAGILLPEPKYSVVVRGTNGMRIEFEPADLKALAGASYFYVEKYAQIGAPSQTVNSQSLPHPAVFDLALRHGLARGNQAFVIDSNLGPEIWNESVVGYHRTIEKSSLLNAVEQVKFPQGQTKVSVKIKLETLGEIDIKDSNNPTKARISAGEMLTEINTGYDLVLDKNGQIVDGQWHPANGTRGVDFAWFVGGKGHDAHYAHQGGNPYLNYKTIRNLFKESVHPSCRRLFN